VENDMPVLRPQLLVILAAALASSGCIIPIVDLSMFGGPPPLEERTLQGRGKAKVAMIEIDGVIAFSETGFSLMGHGPSIVARMQEALDLAADDENVRALLLRIHSPGGSVAASETLHHLLTRWKAHTGKPIVAYIQGVGASGGYYVAMPADEVIAHPTAITGSIGVIMPGINLAGLLDRFDIEDQTLTSGAYKDSGSMLRPMRDDEQAQLQSVVDDLFARFVDVVETGRPELDRVTVEELADGRIYTANQALEAGLVDRIGHLDDAIARATERAGLESARVVTYSAKGESSANIYSRFWSSPPSDDRKVDVDLIPIQQSQLPAGFYYLWPMAIER
jgi:protease-4